jgi:hypothetical protein
MAEMMAKIDSREIDADPTEGPRRAARPLTSAAAARTISCR